MSKNSKILDVISCPICKGKLEYNKRSDELICKFHNLAFPIKDGVPIMLVEKARRTTEK